MQIAKSEQKIETLSEKVGVTDEGQLWLKQALDPFSDTPRRPVGFPDLITGNSVVQVVKLARTYNIGPTAADVHVFMDTMDTNATLYQNAYFSPVSPGIYGNALAVNSVVGVTPTYDRGGLCLRAGNVGTELVGTQTQFTMPLPTQYTSAGTTRVVAKAFEVHNTSNKLNVGGAVTVYRSCGSIPYGRDESVECYNTGVAAPSIGFTAKRLSQIPLSLDEVTRIPGSQQWEAEKGCYVVPIMASQTNNPTYESGELVYTQEGNIPWANAIRAGNPILNPPNISGGMKQFSPFFLCGAYFTGLPANSELTINEIFYIERFVDASNLDLVVMAQPSPHYDAAAFELYSKTAGRLPHGVKVGDNADGDWIKNIADMLATFGVPGMPLVKGGVDLWNAYNSSGKQIGSPQKSLQVQKNKTSQREINNDKKIEKLLETVTQGGFTKQNFIGPVQGGRQSRTQGQNQNQGGNQRRGGGNKGGGGRRGGRK